MLNPTVCRQSWLNNRHEKMKEKNTMELCAYEIHRTEKCAYEIVCRHLRNRINQFEVRQKKKEDKKKQRNCSITCTNCNRRAREQREEKKKPRIENGGQMNSKNPNCLSSSLRLQEFSSQHHLLVEAADFDAWCLGACATRRATTGLTIRRRCCQDSETI